MGKRLLTTIGLVTILTAMPTAVFADGSANKYNPIDVQGSWASIQLTDLVHQDILTGYVNTSENVELRPSHFITRAEFAQLLVNAVGKERLQQNHQTPKTFIDVKPSDWFYGSVSLLASIGFVSGRDSEHFSPTQYIRRDEMAAMLFRVFQPSSGNAQPKQFTDVPDGYWAKPAIDHLTEVNIVTGFPEGLFKPAAHATRADATAIIYNALHNEVVPTPQDQTLLDVVKNDHEQELQAEASGDNQSLYSVNDNYQTGYLKWLSDQAAGVLVDGKAKGYTYTITSLGEPQFSVIHKSTWTAVVDMKDDAMRMMVTHNGQSTTQSWTDSVHFDLRWMPDGTWKIYDAQAYDHHAN